MQNQATGASQDDKLTYFVSRLITRTLTKYPVDFALFRELLQNGCDAKAEDVVISFKTDVPGGLNSSNMSRIESCMIERLTIKNNGLYFSKDDWDRLREVAKGNPDETKIGAFGVGFYSVFELTDEPLVHSGDTVMSFYFSGDQLCYRKEAIEESQGWTIMDLPYREPKPLPDLPRFIQFLVQSFMFIQLESVELIVDDIKIFSLRKTFSTPTVHRDLPVGLNCYAPDKSMRLYEWISQPFDFFVSYMNITTNGQNIFNMSSNSSSLHTDMSTSLIKMTGKISTNVSPTFAKNLKATIMKPPPKEAVISLISNLYTSPMSSQLPPPLCDFIFPQEAHDAKIYIGFSTKQSTSFKSHISMNQLIPTMERAAVDMANAHVKDWNAQLLHMAGILGRVVYEYELEGLKSKFPSEEYDSGAASILSRYEFKTSTPDASIGTHIADGFWKSSNVILLPSQHGVVSSNPVRFAPEAEFIEDIPIIPQKVIDSAMPFLTRAVASSLLKKLSVDDIVQEAKQRPFTESQFSKLLKWFLENLKSGDLNNGHLFKILLHTNVKLGNPHERILSMASVNCYQDTYTVPDNFPLPSTCVPKSLLPDLAASELRMLFQTPLTLPQWLKYAVKAKEDIPTDINLLKTISFAEISLSHISRFWKTFLPEERKEIYLLLSDVACIPTQQGLKIPRESYLAAIDMFPDLPVRTSDLAASKQFLVDLGVRETVKVDYVLEFLKNPPASGKWSSIDVIKYLCKFQKRLTGSDWKTLKESQFLYTSEGKPFKASELFSPNPDLKTLGFVTFEWPDWYDKSPEANFLYNVGLKHAPPQSSILSLANDPDYNTSKMNKDHSYKADVAMKYYCENFDRNGYSPLEAFGTTSRCIVCTQGGKTIKETPLNCYISPKAGLFGLPVVSEAFEKEAYKFNIRSMDPPVRKLVESLRSKPPATIEEADKKFSYLSTLSGALKEEDKNMLKDCNLIPFEVKRGSAKSIMHLPPSRVFFGDKNDKTLKFYSMLFQYAKFSAAAQPFLSTIGVRREPTIIDVIKSLVANPRLFYQLAKTPKQYLELLIEIYLEWDKVAQNKGLVDILMDTPFLMAVKHVPQADMTKRNYRFEPRVNVQAKPQEVVIVDNMLYYNIFKNDILTAPHENTIEEFYDVR